MLGPDSAGLVDFAYFFCREGYLVDSFLFQPVEAGDEAFWSQFWSESVTNVQDVFTLIPAAEIRALREESPSNLATLCYKAVEKLVDAAENGCRTSTEQQTGQIENFFIEYHILCDTKIL